MQVSPGKGVAQERQRIPDLPGSEGGSGVLVGKMSYVIIASRHGRFWTLALISQQENFFFPIFQDG